jgi:hypothetical protein
MEKRTSRETTLGASSEDVSKRGAHRTLFLRDTSCRRRGLDGRHARSESDGTAAVPVCIYCGHPAGSDEHVIPSFLGEFSGFPHLKCRICGDCNNKFSKLESQLAHSGPEALMRTVVGIRGRRKHKKVNIFTEPSNGAQPIEVIFKDPSSEAQTLAQLQEGGAAELLPTVHAVDDDGHEANILFDGTIASGQQLLDHVREKGLKGTIRLGWMVQGPDRPMVEHMVDTIATKHTLGSWKHVEVPSTVPKMDVQFHFTEKYYRAIAKIAFHYMLAVCPDVMGSEECFGNLRHFIQYGGSKKQYVSPRRGTLLIVPGKKGPDHWSHMFMVQNERGRLTVSMQLFIGPTGSQAPAWEIHLNQVPAPHHVATPTTGTVCSYEPRGDSS